MSTILVVDDDPVITRFLEKLLRKQDHEVFVASHGEEALALLEKVGGDLVLMDIQMPVMDGYTATRHIKSRDWDGAFIPVIFLTSTQDDQDLAQCLECGGDDFLVKPPNRMILKARLRAWLKRAELANQLAEDRRAVEEVILKMRQDDQFDPLGLQWLITPVERTNGDILLSACRQDGIQHLMVGDFTGHGLSAAIAGPLTSDVFYRLTRLGTPLAQIMDSINEVIYRKLPPNMFLAASFLEVDRRAGAITIWNAGLPSVLAFAGKVPVESFPSQQPPLGIRPTCEVITTARHLTVMPDTRLFVVSDGVVETRSPQGEMFGMERLMAFLTSMIDRQDAMETLLSRLAAFRDGREQCDDITLVALTC